MSTPIKFVDSYGKTVKDGDTILIEETYGRRAIEGKSVPVSWDAKKGMFRFSYPPLFINDDFHTVHKFKRLAR